MSFPWLGWQGLDEDDWGEADAPPVVQSQARSGHGGGAVFSGNFFFRHRKTFERLLAKLSREKEAETKIATVAPPPNIQGVVQSISRKAEVCAVRGRVHKAGRASVVKHERGAVAVAKGKALRYGAVQCLTRKREVARPVFRNDTTRIEWEDTNAVLLDELLEEVDQL